MADDDLECETELRELESSVEDPASVVCISLGNLFAEQSNGIQGSWPDKDGLEQRWIKHRGK